MKHITIIFTLICLALITNAQKNVNLHINQKLGTSVFAFNQAAQNNLNQDFKITRVDYYISGVKIIHDGGMEMALPNKYILVKGGAMTMDNLGSLNVTNIEGIKFSIGVDAPINNADPALQSPVHPLYFQTPSMHWGWAAGYRFVALEGTAGPNATPFEIHGLGNANYFGQTVMAAGVNSGNDIDIYVDADYIQALKDINVAAGPIDHGVNTTDLTLLHNFRDNVFKPGTANPSNIKGQNNVNSFVKIYPNPVHDQLSIELIVPNNNTQSVQVIDILGKVQLTAPLKQQHNTIDLSSLAKGSYILKFYEGSKALGSQQIVLR